MRKILLLLVIISCALLKAQEDVGYRVNYYDTVEFKSPIINQNGDTVDVIGEGSSADTTGLYHSNRSVINGISATDTSRYREAYDSLHNHANKTILDNTTASFTTTQESKLSGIEAGAEVNNISDVNATDLTDGGETTLHSHAGSGAMTAEAINDSLKYKLYRPANDTIYMTYDYNYDSNYLEISHDTIVINVANTPLYAKATASYYSMVSGGDTVWFTKTGDSWPLELPSVGYFLMDSSVIYDFDIEHRKRKTTVTLYDTSNLSVVIPDLDDPILDSASVYAANPDSMILYFSETVTGSLGFVVSDTITVSTYTNDGSKIGCLLSDSLVADSIYTVDYNAAVGNVADASSNTLKTLADTTVNNYVVVIGGYDVAFQAVYDAFTTKASAADATAMNAFVVAAKEHGYWTKLDMLHIYATHINSAGEALINWINPGTYDGSENGFSGEAQWNAYRGYTGNGGVQNSFYISFGYEPSVDGVNYTLNSGSIIFYRRNTSSRAATETGTTQSTGATYRAMYGSSNATTRIFRINSNTGDSPTVTDLSGFNAVTRNSGTLYVYRNSGTPLTSYSRAATGVPNTTVTDFMGYAESGMPNSSASDAELSMTAWGGLLTDTDIGYFISDFELLMDYFGTGILP